MKPYIPKVAATQATISRFVGSQTPDIFADVGSQFQPFMEAYYAWMEQGAGSITTDIKSLPDTMHFAKTSEEYMQYFMDEFLPGIPANVLADKRLLIQHARQFYLTRGSVASFKFLFRILYNEDVEIVYPKNNIFNTSDAQWIVNNVIKVVAFDDDIEQIVNRKIFGMYSNATALVESITVQYVGAVKIGYMVISNRYGNFLVDEPISTTDENDDIPQILARILGTVSGATITNAGTGYTSGTQIPISNNGDGTGVFAVVSTVDINGGIVAITIVDGGIEYINTPPTPNIGAMSGTGAAFTFNIGSSFYESGYFVNDKCQLSSTQVLQDGVIYQTFSYILKTAVPYATFIQNVKRLVHPAGMHVSALLVTNNSSNFETVTEVMFHLTHPDDINYIDPESGAYIFQQLKLKIGTVPSPLSVEEIDDEYPGGAPLGMSFIRLFEPSYATVLSTLDQSSVVITT